MSYDPRQFDTYVLSCVVHRVLCDAKSALPTSR